jgi:PAS domain S-box-containing protein
MTIDEQTWSAAIELLEQQFAVLDGEGLIVRCSDGWRAHGRSHLADPSLWEVGSRLADSFSSAPYTPATRSSILASLRGTLAGTGVQSATYSSGHQAATSWHRLTFRAFVVAGRRYVLVAHADVTTSRRLEAEHKRQLAAIRLRAVVAEHTDRAIVILDPRGVIEWVNAGFTQLLGFPPTEVIGGTLSALHGLAVDSATRVLMERRIRAGVGVDIETPVPTKEGGTIWIRGEIRPVRSEEGFLEHFVAMEFDITESRRAAAQLEHERELLHTIVNSVPHFICWMDRDLIVRGCNQQYAQFAGTVAQLPSVEPHADGYHDIDKGIIATGTPALRLRETQLNASGEQRVMMMNRMPLRRRDGSVSGIVTISEDVTEDERAARRTREDEERWTLALEVNDVGVWDFNLLARTVVGSRRWRELVKFQDTWSQDDIPLPVEIVHPDDLPRLTESWNATLRGAIPALEAGLRLLVGDTFRYMRLRGRVVKRDAEGNAERVVGTIVDIHEARQNQMQAATASKLESIGQLAAGIAHEINTPTQYVGDNVRFLGDAFGSLQQCLKDLTALSNEHDAAIPLNSYRDCLSQPDLPYLLEEIPKAITQSLDGIQRIARIVGAMKDFSHPGQELTPTDLNHAIANTIVVATNEWKYVALVETAFDEAMPLVPVIPGEFNQVILNIVVNAAQAIGEARASDSNRRGTIRVETRCCASWAEVRISDDGCGMPPHVQAKIFDPFFTTKPVGKGTGQGLSIAYNLISTKLRGSISVNSEPGRGTTFTIRVPLTLQELADHAA